MGQISLELATFMFVLTNVVPPIFKQKAESKRFYQER
jgi:hypothetical protein